MKSIHKILRLVIFISSACAFSCIGQTLPIIVGVTKYQNIEQSFEKLLKDKTCDQVKFAELGNISRLLAEAILVCKALRIGGIEPEFIFNNYSVASRLLLQIQQDTPIEIMLDSAWLSNIKPKHVLISQALIRKGEFVKGIYTHKDNTQLLNINSLEGLTVFSATSSKNWKMDWDILQEMNIKTYSVVKYSQMLKMVMAKRVDFLLDEFSSRDDLSQLGDNIDLIPVPNIKISFNDSRHILVNKHKTNARLIYNALEKGLSALRQDGTIEEAYQKSGFINKRTKKWQSICCLN